MFKLKKIVIAGLLSASLALSCLIATPVSVMAAELSVYLDGEKLIYKDPQAQPQIINDRTMVPLRETAEYFGMEFTWNEETSTMVFIGRGRTVIHTIYSNTIYVNGQAFEFEFNSTIVNDRTLMPIRMLAEAIGCKVEWVGEIYRVNIYSEYYSDDDTPDEPTPERAPEPTPEPLKAQPPATNTSVAVYSAVAESTEISAGDEVTIILSTSKGATKAKVADGYGNIYDEITEYSEDSQGRYFTFYIPLSEEGDNALRVFAGNDSMYSSNYKIVNVTVGKAAEKISVIAIDIEESELLSSDQVEGIVRTSRNAVKIVVKDSDERIIKTITQSDYRSANYRDWSFSFDLDEDIDSGEHTYYISAYDEKGNEASESFSFNINGEISTTPVISKVSYDYEIVGSNYNIIFTIKTDKTAIEVRLYDEGGSRIALQDSYDDTSQRTFDLEYNTDDDSHKTYTIRVYGNNGKYSEEEIEVVID